MSILNVTKPDVHQKYAENKEMFNIQASVNAIHVSTAFSYSLALLGM